MLEAIKHLDGYESIPESSEFEYWFYRNADSTYTIYVRDHVYQTWSGMVSVSCIYDILTDKLILEDTDSIKDGTAVWDSRIFEDWERFKLRPEFVVGLPVDVVRNIKQLNNNDLYDWLLVGCHMVRTGIGTGRNYDPDDHCLAADRCLKYLHTTDFYEAPASTIYHDSVLGGLRNHTISVVCNVLDLMRTITFSRDIRLEDALLVALVHDWCKIGMYESYKKNVKNEVTGVWEKQDSFRCKENRYSSLGHGVSSMFIASKFFHLSVEEANAIRWHMGEYNVAENEMNELHQANEKYPLVQLIQFADRMSITKYKLF